MKTYKQFKAEVFRTNKNIKREYEMLEPEVEAIKKFVELRRTKNITQSELAQLIGTKQSAISRFERNLIDPSIYFLSKVANALGKRLEIRFK